jgi:hypothetical protein
MNLENEYAAHGLHSTNTATKVITECNIFLATATRVARFDVVSFVDEVARCKLRGVFLVACTRAKIAKSSKG